MGDNNPPIGITPGSDTTPSFTWFAVDSPPTVGLIPKAITPGLPCQRETLRRLPFHYFLTSRTRQSAISDSIQRAASRAEAYNVSVLLARAFVRLRRPKTGKSRLCFESNRSSAGSPTTAPSTIHDRTNYRSAEKDHRRFIRGYPETRARYRVVSRKLMAAIISADSRPDDDVSMLNATAESPRRRLFTEC